MGDLIFHNPKTNPMRCVWGGIAWWIVLTTYACVPLCARSRLTWGVRRADRQQSREQVGRMLPLLPVGHRLLRHMCPTPESNTHRSLGAQTPLHALDPASFSPTPPAGGCLFHIYFPHQLIPTHTPHYR